ncbi:Alpha/Beta hydrolase protein [Pelagophyceae sp. CCMP2097]|nr:Alpha/Beta hydrolase protein [Pelagophyceae sp. CCMP2097]|mmetsp:Transcript_8740/g.28739  ORF Transcript_8740/g.28739 Transcript_8740/m.28739 type:complete len:676 (-) Transcript_8740:134-2161(-)
MQRVAVTGVGGRLGGAIARRLQGDSRFLVAAGVDRFPGAVATTHVVDLTTPGLELERAFAGADVVVHGAALPGPSRIPPPGVAGDLGTRLEALKVIGLESEAPVDLAVANVASTLRVLDAAAKAGVKRVIISSSAFAMGWSHDSSQFQPKKLPISDADAPRPHETYGLSKELGDLCGAMYARTGSMEVVALRFTNVVKGEVYDSLPWKYDKHVPLVMWAWCHEDDVVEAHVAAAVAPSKQLFEHAEEERYVSLLICAPSTRYATDTTDLLSDHFGPSAAKMDLTGLKGNSSVLCGKRATSALRPWAPRCWTAQKRGMSTSTSTAARGSKAARAALNDADVEFFDLEGFELESGLKLPKGASLAYRVHGDITGRVILHPTAFGGVHSELEYNIEALLGGQGGCVVAANMLGGGVSFSPSNCAAPQDFPNLTVADNAKAQRALLFKLGKEKVDVIYGYSMGAMQALAYARLFPAEVAHVIAVCGAAGCTDHNAVFLDALSAALAKAHIDRAASLRAFALVYAGWGVGYEFYRDKVWAKDGFASLEDFLESYVASFADDDPDDLLAMVRTWRACAVPSATDLRRITAQVLLLPCDTDRYFRLDEAMFHEAAHIKLSTINPMRSRYGHRAGDPWRPGMETEKTFLHSEISNFLYPVAPVPHAPVPQRLQTFDVLLNRMQ